MRGSHHSSEHQWSGNWQALKQLLPYFAEFKGRVILALGFLLLAKLTGVLVPAVMKHIVDALDSNHAQIIAVPLLLLLLYGGLRLGSILFGEIRDAIFGRVSERAMHRIGLKLFEHLHSLDLEFHLSKHTGSLPRDIERGTNGIGFLLRFTLFNILPTLLEILLVAGILLFNFDMWYALIILIAVVVYVAYSIIVTDWRTHFVREANEIDNKTNARVVDSLLNFETVKYFGNEGYEAQEYDKHLSQWETARARNRLSLATLNSGQGVVIAASITAMMILAARDVVSKQITLGDLVMINAYMMQLFLPLNFLGFVYREIKRALADIENMFALLAKQSSINDSPAAETLEQIKGVVSFQSVAFHYQQERPLLQDISFDIPVGKKLAVVGPSGSGKSTLARLLFRFYDVNHGAICIDGQDIRQLTQHSLRAAIGIVPQDTVLFNNTIYYNIAYGRPDASDAEIKQAARMAHLEAFILKLPKAYDTLVGERGLKVSGGEKQRIAIARMLLKNPRIMVFDEATSSLDSAAEGAIMQSLREIAMNHTTLVIAHRLSTITDADQILVLEHGKISERGTHHELLRLQGSYAKLWALQQRQQDQTSSLA